MVAFHLGLTQQADVDLKPIYDAVVVGSGAAGGMAAHVLTSHGLKVLLLEAGKKLDLESELKSMEWPYEHPRRGDMPPGYHAMTLNEYSIRTPPYAVGQPYPHLKSRIQGGNGADYSKNIVVDEQEHPFTGTRYAWVRARCVGGRTNLWARHALRLSNYDFRARTHDGFGEDWPITYSDVALYYDRVDRYLGISGVRENLPQLPDSIFQRPVKLNYSEIRLREKLARMGRTLTPYRAGVTTDGLKHNRYRSLCFGRGACSRRVGGCDIHAAFDSPTGLIYPALDTGHLTLRPNSIVSEILVDTNTGKAKGVAFIDADTHKTFEVKAKIVVLGASTFESTRLMLLSKSKLYPNGIGNSSGHLGHNICEHIMGPSVNGMLRELIGKSRTLDDGRPGGFYVARFRNLEERRSDFIRGYGFQGYSGTGMFPGNANSTLGFGAAYKKRVREEAGAYIWMGGFGEVLARYENHVSLDPQVKDRWGIPVLRFHFEFGDNEKKMAKDMIETARESFEAAGIEVLNVGRQISPEGSSIHEMGTARMGSDRKTSVLNQFQQTHDVRNLFVVDGSSHVSAGCQNPTWTIMALCWRSCDYLVDEFKKGNL